MLPRLLSNLPLALEVVLLPLNDAAICISLPGLCAPVRFRRRNALPLESYLRSDKEMPVDRQFPPSRGLSGFDVRALPLPRNCGSLRLRCFALLRVPQPELAYRLHSRCIRGAVHMPYLA